MAKRTKKQKRRDRELRKLRESRNPRPPEPLPIWDVTTWCKCERQVRLWYGGYAAAVHRDCCRQVLLDLTMRREADTGKLAGIRNVD